jgi:hypothetical protein
MDLTEPLEGNAISALRKILVFTTANDAFSRILGTLAVNNILKNC